MEEASGAVRSVVKDVVGAESVREGAVSVVVDGGAAEEVEGEDGEGRWPVRLSQRVIAKEEYRR